MRNYLMIIGCSQRKVEVSEPLPAVDRYDGPTYQILRKMRREGFTLKNLDVLIISAKHGLLACQQPIENYDQRMTAERAEELLSQIQNGLLYILSAKPGKYDEVFIHLGKNYQRSLEGFDWGLISTLEASGGIGLKNQQMKAWLERLSKEKYDPH